MPAMGRCLGAVAVTAVVVALTFHGTAAATPAGPQALSVTTKRLSVGDDRRVTVLLRCRALRRACRASADLRFAGASTARSTVRLRKASRGAVRLTLRVAQLRAVRVRGQTAAVLTLRPRHGGKRRTARLTLRYRRQTSPTAPAPPATPAQPGASASQPGASAPQPGAITEPLDPPPSPPVTPEIPPDPHDGLPRPLPDVPRSQALAPARYWTPSSSDTCPSSVHDRFDVIGPDGKRYPGWHPPSVLDPATGKPCTFGHEHGADPRGSDLYEWVSGNLAAAGLSQFAGIPFGTANETLDAYAAANPGTPTRHEDHVGHKLDFVNDVQLRDASNAEIGVSCDYLFKLHQGTHSPDALANNAHELIFASRCSDGSETLTVQLATFGRPGEFNRSCGAQVRVPGQPVAAYPEGGGSRLIPDASCIGASFSGTTTPVGTFWSMYENWRLDSAITAADGRTLARFDPDFAVFDPSRHGASTTPGAIARPLDFCWTPSQIGGGCQLARRESPQPFAFDDSRSPFTGSKREFFIGDVRISNQGGPVRWYTDPYGRNGQPTAFPGALCQLISPTDTSGRPELARQVHRRGSDYGAVGVHAPN